MEWKKCYLDVMLVPLGLLLYIGYHVWLRHKVCTQPFTTIIGINANSRRFWVPIMMKDIEKKNIVAVQSLRNLVMGSNLMATTSILLSAGLAAVVSSTYSVKKPLDDTVYGANHSELMVSLKYVTLLTIFLFSFFCHSQSIRFINLVCILVCTPQDDKSMFTAEYLTELLEKGFIMNTLGNRVFYSALPLLLWIFGPLLVFLCFLAMLPVLYNLDFVCGTGKPEMEMNGNGEYSV
ncbi:hypothetical protein L6164_008228 [Bauhinia variegata]|uniref:Uncharacterized protein n=1 Tax=Bauhinia variegata TaxID=167791 RepID=A0ACB9PFV6_BAUVA|nr:hypothetical protein L6164_008228 [Bauhinia variegata]